MPGSIRTINRLGAPYERPWPRAASTSTFGPHVRRAVETTVWKPRVRLLAPRATTRPISPSIFLVLLNFFRRPRANRRLSPCLLHELRSERFVPVWDGADLFLFQKPFCDLLQV